MYPRYGMVLHMSTDLYNKLKSRISVSEIRTMYRILDG